MQDVVIVGAGPVGLACALEARREGLQALVIEKGTLVNSLVGYPARMEFFSTPELIEIGGYPFPIQGYKPTREDAIEYYRGVAGQERIDVRLYERVVGVTGGLGNFTVTTDRGKHPTRHVIASIGFFDQPNTLEVPGADLPKVRHYYKEPYAYVRQKVAVIGARNSAAKAALDCYRHGAEVTLIVRGPSLSDKVKYWIKPDLENRIKEGTIKAFFNTTVEAIHESSLNLRTPEGEDVDRQRLGARHDRLPPRLRLPRGDAADRNRGRSAPDTGVRSRHFRDEPARCLPRRHGVRRLPYWPVVHRERPLPRPADRQAHRAGHDREGRVPIGSIGKRRNKSDAALSDANFRGFQQSHRAGHSVNDSHL